MTSPGNLELAEMDDPSLLPGGALLKVRSCAICGTDVKMLRNGHRDLVYPRILGHEIVAELIDIDDPSANLRVGDMVQVWPGVACGKCPECRRGNDQRCSSIGILGFNLDGGLADKLSLPNCRGLVPVPRSIDPGILTLAEPLACCINAQDRLHVSEGDSVLIMGAGPLGVMNAVLARSKGVSDIIMTDVLESRLRNIPPSIVDMVIDVSRDGVEGLVLDRTGGRGVDVLIPCTPEVKVDETIMRSMAPGGRVCIFSGPKKEDSIMDLDIRDLHYRETTVVGSYGNSSRNDRKAVQMIVDGDLDIDWMITARFGLEDVREAFEHADARNGLKAVVDID